MENKQDIGKAFKDRLGGLHREPGDAVWQNISASLQQQKRGFRIPFWGKATSIVVAVALVVIFTHPYWEQYMPEIIIKMPGEKQETLTGNASTPATTVPDAKSETAVSNTAANPAVANTPAPVQNKLPGSTATPRSQGGSANSSNGTGATANGTLNNANYTNGSAPVVINKSTNTYNANTNPVTGTSAKANANPGVATTSDKNYNVGKSMANHTIPSSAIGKNSSKASASTRTGIASVSAQKAAGIGKTNGTAGADTSSRGNPSSRIAATAEAQNEAASQIAGTATTPAGTSGVTKAPDAYDKGSAAKNLDGNLVYSNTGTYPTITKALADSLLLAQEAIDEQKSRERTFAQPAYALQDVGGGDGYRNDFYVFAFIAPTNYKFGESTSLIDPSLDNHGTSAETSNNYGAYIGYEFSSQFSVRTGISSVGITQRTGNVSMGADYSGVNYANGMTNSQAATALGNNPVTLRQKTSVVEVPLEATYAMFGTRADLYFKGGVSMFFMNENRLYAENGQGSVLLGGLNRAQDFSLSGNAGFGFYYKFTRELQLNVEPGFKYYFNTFKDVNPVSFYAQAGLLYRF